MRLIFFSGHLYFEVVFISMVIFIFEVILIFRNLNFFRSSWFWGQDNIQFCLNSLSCFHFLVILTIYECGTAQTSYQNMSSALLKHLEKKTGNTPLQTHKYTHTHRNCHIGPVLTLFVLEKNILMNIVLKICLVHLNIHIDLNNHKK